MKYFWISLLFICISCGSTAVHYYSLPTFNKNNLNAVIEIPAGTNLKIEYNPDTNRFLPDQRDGKDRFIEFLGYPGNYGFIPSTYSDPNLGGDGDALDVIILGESIPTGTIQHSIVLGILKLQDEGATDAKIIAIPAEFKNQRVKAKKWQDITRNYPEILEILELWFTNYDKENQTVVLGWGDEKEALAEIRRWQMH